jgi:hypothetical protein
MSASAFYTRLTSLVKEADAELSYAGDYLGWPVDYINFAVNEGRATVYGGSLRLDLVHVLDLERRVEAHAALALADGREWPHHAGQSDEHLPIGSMSPMQLQFGGDVDWGNWSVAPRLGIVGRQRVVAMIGEGDALRRRTLDGHAVMNVNIPSQPVVQERRCLSDAGKRARPAIPSHQWPRVLESRRTDRGAAEPAALHRWHRPADSVTRHAMKTIVGSRKDLAEAINS